MKKIALYIALVLGFSSCEKQLTTDLIGLTTLEDVTSTPNLSTVENSVNSSYQLLSSRLNILAQWDWPNGLVIQPDIIMQDIASDDLEKKWNPDGDQVWIDDINNFTFTSINGGPNGLWKYNYEGIKRLNIALDLLNNPEIETLTGISPTRKNQLLGEAYFLRSFYYFSLVTNFGGVPLILAPVKKYQEAFDNAVKATPEAVYANIKKELDLAITYLPSSKYSSSTDRWRASKGAAIALRAKVALFNREWTDVITLVQDLQTLNYFNLNENYFDSFTIAKEFNENEVIFCYDHRKATNPLTGNGLTALMGWGFFAPSTSFLNEFEANDPRLFYTVDVSKQNVNKLLGSVDGGNKGDEDAANNRIFIRFADVLLWKAEAYIETNNFTEAIAIINQIRTRARNSVTGNDVVVPQGTLADRPSSTDKAQVTEWLRHERRVELGLESHRLLDLKRWGIAKDVLTTHGKNYQDRHNLYPIPQLEVDASAGLLIQNPGY